MNFDLTDEQLQVRDMVREFAGREVAPYIRDWDAKGELPGNHRPDGRAHFRRVKIWRVSRRSCRKLSRGSRASLRAAFVSL